MLNIYYDAWPYDLEVTPGKGAVGSKYAFVGIAPSPNRPKARRNEPFGSRSWELLNRIIASAPPGGIYLTNLVKTPLPFGKKVPKKVFNVGSRLLYRELSYIRPYRILALGTDTARALCPGFKELRDDHGVMFMNESLSNRIGHPVVVVPTYHFSAIGRDPSKKSILARDLERFFELPDPEAPKYVEVKAKIPDFQEGATVYLDIETEGPNDNFNPYEGTITSLGLGVKYNDTAVMYKYPSKQVLIDLYRKLKERKCTLCGQNFQFDLYWLSVQSGLEWDIPVEDTMLLAHNQGEKIVGLKHLSTMLTNRPGPHAFGGFQDLGYAAEDIHATKAVDIALKDIRPPQHVDKLMWSAVPELVMMRTRGVYIDRPLLSEFAADFRVRVAEKKKAMLDEWGPEAALINWNASAQVVELFKKNGIRLTERTKAGAYTVKESVLLSLQDKYPKVKSLLEYRALEKTLTGFFEGYLEMTTDAHPYLHPFQDLRGAETGRTSMKGPNLQQVTRTGPSKLIFKSRWEGGKFGLIDLKQAELRAACLISGDSAMAQAIRSGDPHRYGASIAFHMPPEKVPADLRKRVKGVIFGKLYGGSSAGLAKRIGISVDDVDEVDAAIFGSFTRLAEWLVEIKRFGVENLYVEDAFGRRRDLSDLMREEGYRSVERKACNTPIQALASHMAMTILSQTSINLRERGLKSITLFGIHDSTLLDIHPRDPITEVHQCIQDAFYSLNYTPLAHMPLWRDLPIEGELVVGNGWAAVESTSDYYDKENNLYFDCGTQVHPSEVMNKKVTELSLA